MLLWLSLKSFFKANKLLAAAFCLMLTVCLIAGIFGINYACCNADFYNRYISAQKSYYVCGSAHVIQKHIAELTALYAFNIDCAWADVKLNVNGGKVKAQALAYLSDDYYNIFSVAYGARLSADEIKNGDKKIMLSAGEYSADMIGKAICVAADEYEVVGLGASQYFVPLAAIDLKNTNTELELQIVLSEPLYSAVEKQNFADELDKIFEGCRIVCPDDEDVRSAFDYVPLLLPTLILLLLGFVDLVFLYVYFIKMRNRHRFVFRINGATQFDIFSLFISELTMLYTSAFAFAMLVYKLVAAVWFAAEASLTGTVMYDAMSLPRCILLYFVLLLLFVILFVPMLIRANKNGIMAEKDG